MKKVLKLYFVSGQKNKLSNKFLKSVDGCEQLSTNVLSGCFGFMKDLMDMEHEISAKQPLSRGNSIRAQRIILQYSRSETCLSPDKVIPLVLFCII